MKKMKARVPHRCARPAHLSAQQLARQSDPGGGLAPAFPGSAEKREIIVSRAWRFSPWVLGILAAAPLAPASGQNLDAGKPASQIFAEVCANCHRSPREVRNNPGVSFLREHYTTGSDMASTMAAYLSSAGGDPRATGAAQPKRQANPATATAPAATTREAPAGDAARDPRRAQPTADPKAVPPGSTRGRPGSARAESTAETKPPAPPPPPPPPGPIRPALEEFEQ
jgi:hypothetical protein